MKSIKKTGQVTNKNPKEKNSIKRKKITIHQNKNLNLQYIPHYLIPGLNAHNINEIKNYKEISTSLPWPVYTSNIQLNAIDLCHKRVKENDYYQRKLKRVHGFYNTAKNRKEYKKGIKNNIYPCIVIKFAELLEKCPDLYFNSRYDWYYTGGNLCPAKNISQSNKNYIFHVTGKNLDELVLSKTTNCNENNDKIQLNCIDSVQLKESHVNQSSEIYEIQSRNLSLSDICCVTRQKYSITQYHYHSTNDENDGKDNLLNYDFTLRNTEVPFISFAINPCEETNLITSDLHKTIKLWDIENSIKNPKQILYAPDLINDNEKNQNWNNIKYFKQNTYAYVDFDNFKIFDIRQSSSRKKRQEFITFKEFYNSCEQIVNLSPSKYNDNHIYIGTTHKLFAIDVRYLSPKKDKSIVSKWTHQMHLPPIILKIYNNQENEIILLGSPYYEDIRLCEHKSSISNLQYDNNSKEKFYSSLPLMPSNKIDAYNKLRIEGNCLDISYNLESRIKCCNTGLSFLDDNNNNNQKSYILQSNSVGDIFIQRLHKSPNEQLQQSSDEMDFIKDKWIEYENNLKIKNQNTPLNLTYMENFSSFEKVFRCKRLSRESQKFCEKSKNKTLIDDNHKKNNENNLNATDDEFDEPKRPRRLQKWQRSFDNLKQYKDALTNDILSIWDDIDTVDDNMSNTSKNLKKLSKINGKDDSNVNVIPSEQLVSDWLNKSTIIDKYALGEDDYNNETETIISKIEDTSCINLNISKNMNETMSLCGENSDLFETKIHTDVKALKKRKKSKYNMGF